MCVFERQNKIIILTASSRASLNETGSPQQVCCNEEYNDYWDNLMPLSTHIQVPAVLLFTASATSVQMSMYLKSYIIS